MDKKIENKEEEEFNGVDYIWVPGDDFVDEFLVELQELEENNSAVQTAGEAAKHESDNKEEQETINIKSQELNQGKIVTRKRAPSPTNIEVYHQYKRPRPYYKESRYFKSSKLKPNPYKWVRGNEKQC